jgi:hypothetical protein
MNYYTGGEGVGAQLNDGGKYNKMVAGGKGVGAQLNEWGKHNKYVK